MNAILLGKISKEGRLLPLFGTQLPAGFPSAADDYLEKQLDLHALLVEHPVATFFIRIEGDSMINAGMHSGDILVVDRSLSPQSGKIVVALIDGEFTVKRLKIEGKKVYLLPENPLYHPIEIQEGTDFQVWGVVTYAIHRTC